MSPPRRRPNARRGRGGLFLFDGKKCPGFFFVKQHIFGTNGGFFYGMFFFWGGSEQM